LGADDSVAELGSNTAGNGIISPFVALAGVYLYLFISSTPENAQALSNPQLADLARFLGKKQLPLLDGFIF